MTYASISAITVEELHTSRTFSNDAGQWTLNRSFLAYPTTANTNVGLTGLMQHPSIPRSGSRHPEFATAVVVGHEMSPIEEHSGAYKIDVKYVASGLPDTGGNPNSNAPGFVTEAVNMRVSYVDVYRNNASPYAVPDEDETTDIGGKCADTAGNPYSYPLPLMELQYTENIPFAPKFNYYSNFVATRNSAAFAGAGIGEVVYFGANSKQLTPEVWQIQHTFVWDKQFKHRRQQAMTDENGRVQLSAKEGNDSNGFCAEKVTWIQPFPRIMNFNPLLEYNPYSP